MSTSVSSSSASEYQDGPAFRYKSPKVGLSLRAVDIKDGVPKLRFSTSHKVPSITEEDVAVCIQLCLEKRRPEFFYCPFLESHPFTCLGRHYKQYKPSWLRGTSVGELFAEADWKMKCLGADVMSDESKQTFKSWSKASKLDGLATWEKFPREKDAGQVLMTCKSVDISESKDELFFVGEPEMKINVTASPSHTDYLTEHFDSIGYHDEPSFLKMKEIVKLMLAVEWLRDNGVQFSEEWIKEHTNKQKSGPRKPVQINLSDEERTHIIEQFQEEIESAVKKLPPIPDLPSTEDNSIDTIKPKISLIAADRKVSDSGVELKLETTHADPVFKALTDLYVPVVTKVTVKLTVDDFDFLLEGMDPNEPVTVDKDDGLVTLVNPDVSSWSELFAETMPYPCKIIEGPGENAQIFAGGCTTSTIPVREAAFPTTRVTETAQVQASKFRKREKIVPSSSSQRSRKCPPPRDVCLEHSTTGEKKEAPGKVGWRDNISSRLFTGDGKPSEQKPSLKGLVKIQQLIGGKEVGEAIFIDMHLRSSHKKALEDSAYCMRSLTAT